MTIASSGVSARDVDTGVEQAITVTASSGLTEDEIREMIAENQEVALASAKTDCREVLKALKRWESLVVPEMDTWLSQYRMTSSPDSAA